MVTQKKDSRKQKNQAPLSEPGDTRRLKAEALRFQAMTNSKFPEGTSECYRFLRDWLVTHIQDCHKK